MQLILKREILKSFLQAKERSIEEPIDKLMVGNDSDEQCPFL